MTGQRSSITSWSPRRGLAGLAAASALALVSLPAMAAEPSHSSPGRARVAQHELGARRPIHVPPTLAAAIRSVLGNPGTAEVGKRAGSHSRPNSPGTPSTPRQVIAGDLPSAVMHGRASVLGKLRPTLPMRIVVALRLRDMNGLNRLLARASEPKSPDYRRYLSVHQATRLFAPSRHDQMTVAAWLRGQGLQITHESADHLLVTATGTVAAMDKTFHVRILRYRARLYGRRTSSFYAPSAPPSTPSAFGRVIRTVLGLDDATRVVSNIVAHTVRAHGIGGHSWYAPGSLYFPNDYRNAYGVPDGETGAGQHIGIIGWDAPPTDAALYEWGCSVLGGLRPVNFVCASQYPYPSRSAGTLVWHQAAGDSQADSPESALDVEETFGMAPGATIDYWESASNSIPDLLTELDNAGSTTGSGMDSVISNSWGECEPSGVSSGNAALDSVLALGSVTGHDFLFSSGDSGSYCAAGAGAGDNPYPEYPASSPYVTSVGGTAFGNGDCATKAPYDIQSYPGEQAWCYNSTGSSWPRCDSSPCPEGGGGGYSAVEARPPWQLETGSYNASLGGCAAAGTTGCRAYPDVSAAADPNFSGALVITNETSDGVHVYDVGGTSLAAPLWAGMMTDMNGFLAANGQSSLGFANPALYALAASAHNGSYGDFHDINPVCSSGSGGCGNGAYSTSAGWDPVTGLGSPDVRNLQTGLAGFAPTAPSGTSVKELDAPNAAFPDLLGYSVSLSADGSVALVGAEGRSVAGKSDQGAAFVFSGPNYSHVTELTASDGATNDEFGYQVALSGDGKVALVSTTNGLNGNGKVAAYVFSGPNFQNQTELTAPDGQTDDWFGSAVALNGDGSVASIGAPQHNLNGLTGNGVVYIYSGPGYSAQSELQEPSAASGDSFGTSVALSSDGSEAIVGASGDTFPSAFGSEPHYGQGSAYVFKGPGYNTVTQLVASTGALGDGLGTSVALNSAGTVAIVGAVSHQLDGAFQHGSYRGAAWVFSGPNFGTQTELSAADGFDTQYFGFSVALNGSGSEAVVGAEPVTGRQGSIYVFSGVNYGTQQELTAAGGQPGNRMGRSVAVSADGSLALSGSSVSNGLQGAAYVFALGSLQTTTALSWSSTSSNPTFGQNVTFAASVSSQLGMPSGSVAFMDGTTLVGSSTLNAGHASYVTSALPAGVHNLSAVFTPASGTGSGLTYAGSTSDATSLTILKAPPTLSWTAPDSISYGTPLSSTQLNAQSSVPGTFVYSPSSGTVLPAGSNQTLTATFTPLDAADYVSGVQVTTSVSVTPVQAIPAVALSMVRGRAAPNLAALSANSPGLTYTGLVNGDSAGSALGGTLNCTSTTSITTTTPVGMYPVTCATAGLTSTNGDYSFPATVSGTIAVASGVSLTYTGPSSINGGVAPTTLTANLAAGSAPVSNELITFTYGPGLAHPIVCTATTDASGNASCQIAGLPAGPHTMDVEFAGDALYPGAGGGASVAVVTATLTYTGPILIPGGVGSTSLSATLVAGTTPLSGRLISFTYGPGLSHPLTCSASTDAGGTASCAIRNPPPGPHTMNVTYAGDAVYPAASGGASVTVALPKLTYTGSPSILGGIGLNQFSASLLAGPIPVSGQTVTFTYGPGLAHPFVCSGVTDSSGNVSCNLLNLPSGTHTLDIEFAGGGPYPATGGGASIPVYPAKLTYTGPAAIGGGVGANQFSATLLAGTTPIANATLSFTYGPGLAHPFTCSGVTDSSGNASCSMLNLPSGTHTLDIEYAGAGPYAATSGGASVPVNPAKVTYTGPSTIGGGLGPNQFTATLLAGATPVPNETLTFTFGPGLSHPLVCTAQTDQSGTATCTINNLPTDRHSLDIEFAGDGPYLASGGGASITVNPATLTYTGPTSFSGRSGSTVFSATLIAGATPVPNETLTFIFAPGLSHPPTCTAVTDNTGTASCSLSNLPGGRWNLNVAFAGDVTYAAKVIGVVVQNS